MEKLRFTRERDLSKILSSKKTLHLNFLNNHDLYWFKTNPLFRKSLESPDNMNFIDGFIVSFYLSLTRFRHIGRYRGPAFSRDFLNLKQLKNKKILFIGLSDSDLKIITKKFRHLKKKDLFCYNPPFVKGIEFGSKEIKKMSDIVNKNKIDFVFNGMGCPKQNILSYQISKKINRKVIFLNVGAALDFILEKKKEPKGLIQGLGMEWLFRLITDFNHSKKKSWRSFKSLFYLTSIGLSK